MPIKLYPTIYDKEQCKNSFMNVVDVFLFVANFCILNPKPQQVKWEYFIAKSLFFLGKHLPTF